MKRTGGKHGSELVEGGDSPNRGNKVENVDKGGEGDVMEGLNKHGLPQIKKDGKEGLEIMEGRAVVTQR